MPGIFSLSFLKLTLCSHMSTFVSDTKLVGLLLLYLGCYIDDFPTTLYLQYLHF